MNAFCLAVTVLVGAVVSQTYHPCLPDQTEFIGSDSQQRYSYNALDFHRNMYGMKRGDFHTIKDYGKLKGYDITPTSCHVYNISSKSVYPQCVPDSAGQSNSRCYYAWLFRIEDGTTLLYAVNSPSEILEVQSADYSEDIEFMGTHANISDPTIFTIPARCGST